MKILVQKYGGTSTSTPQTRAYIYEKISKALKEGYAVVVVLSAMGRKGDPYATDTLLNVFSGGHKLCNNREQDMIYSCGEVISGCVASNELLQLGIKSVLLNGEQAAIVTNECYSNADIQSIDPAPIIGWLKKGYVVLVTGGQGISKTGNITTLGRGGSDTTACALGYYLNAEEVQIYTDVDGIYTADPRVVQQALKIPRISYDQCQKLAEFGAKVIHPKAVAYARLSGRNILSVRSTFSDDPGTAIGDYCDNVFGITATRGHLCIQVPSDKFGSYMENLQKSKIHPLLYLEKEGTVHCYVSQEQTGNTPSIETIDSVIDMKECDVIFAVGTGIEDRVNQCFDNDATLQNIWIISEDCVAIACESEQYKTLINQLHDKLCIRRG